MKWVKMIVPRVWKRSAGVSKLIVNRLDATGLRCAASFWRSEVGRYFKPTLRAFPVALSLGDPHTNPPSSPLIFIACFKS